MQCKRKRLGVSQFDVKKRMVYGAIVLIWTAMPIYVMTISVLGSDIVNGTCIPYGAYSSYAAEKTMISSGFLITYLLPLVLMTFCYSRIVYTLRKKVTLVTVKKAKITHTRLPSVGFRS